MWRIFWFSEWNGENRGPIDREGIFAGSNGWAVGLYRVGWFLMGWPLTLAADGQWPPLQGIVGEMESHDKKWRGKAIAREGTEQRRDRVGETAKLDKKWRGNLELGVVES